MTVPLAYIGGNIATAGWTGGPFTFTPRPAGDVVVQILAGVALVPQDPGLWTFLGDAATSSIWMAVSDGTQPYRFGPSSVGFFAWFASVGWFKPHPQSPGLTGIGAPVDGSGVGASTMTTPTIASALPYANARLEVVDGSFAPAGSPHPTDLSDWIQIAGIGNSVNGYRTAGLYLGAPHPNPSPGEQWEDSFGSPVVASMGALVHVASGGPTINMIGSI